MPFSEAALEKPYSYCLSVLFKIFLLIRTVHQPLKHSFFKFVILILNKLINFDRTGYEVNVKSCIHNR